MRDINEIGFQTTALNELIDRCKRAQKGYTEYRESHIFSMSAPTGSGKTIIMASLIEAILRGGRRDCPALRDAVVLWLSDDPELNKQSMEKIERHADKLGQETCVTIEGEKFDQKELSDGKVYFLNTDKLREGSKLVSNKKDDREYTIWQTFQNTIESKGKRFFVIIDEAHRGMKEGKEKQEANSIMQKFIFGSPADKMSQMPIIIGMSATPERFNKLIGNVEANRLKPVNISPADVRGAGLLKDKIEIKYVGESQMQMEFSILKCAAHEWKEKCERWHEYCRDKDEQVSPIFIIQVENKKYSSTSATDLEACIEAIEEETGVKFRKGEVVHTFGDKNDLNLKGLVVPHMEPSRIQENETVKIVFFKDRITTGWDCPRAETMMSFRRATDPTYIAQLMGRMVRTPLKRRIHSDETLNSVHLYLPHFDKETAESVVRALHDDGYDNVSTSSANSKELQVLNLDESMREVYDWIKGIQIDTWEVKHWKINSYLTSLARLATLIMTQGIEPKAKQVVVDGLTEKVRKYVEQLKAQQQYDEKMESLSKFMMKGGSIDFLVDTRLTDSEAQFTEISEKDILREFSYSESKLASLGIGVNYCKTAPGTDDLLRLRKEFILFTLSEACMEDAKEYAKELFLNYQNKYGGELSKDDDVKDEYDRIIREGEESAPHKWEYTRRDEFSKSEKMKPYDNHLLVDENGKAFFNLNEWEQDVLDAEMSKEGFVCWIRNLPRKPWSLCIKYGDADDIYPLYPDLIVVRKEAGEYKLVILEPHWDTARDSYPKAKGMLAYSKANEQVSRIELIRKVDGELWRLDFKDAIIRNKMKDVKGNDMLDDLFHKIHHPV
ncbi:MAG: DEAD/DEAH box helicase family protein [Bacteroidaceae bacterium]|nr:DEAD/DEAH box helicase family protein [Bacteroidaceae bacterium]